MPVAITLSGSDIEGDELTYYLSTPEYGALNGIAPDLIYAPDPGYTGTDKFSFYVKDGEFISTIAEVNIMIDYGTFFPVISR